MSGILLEHTATVFVKPKAISEERYALFKTALQANGPYISLFKQTDSRNLFKDYFRGMIISTSIILVCLLLTNLFGEYGVLTLFMLFSGIFLFASIYRFFKEEESYAKYEEERFRYFLRMKFEILRSNYYEEFTKYFYTTASTLFDEEFSHWKKLYLKKQL